MVSLSSSSSTPPAARLPSCHQTWVHSVVSQAQLRSLLQQQQLAEEAKDPAKDAHNGGLITPITALETDVVWGTHQSHGDTNSDDNHPTPTTKKEAICAHPPDTTSDLSLEQLLSSLSSSSNLHLKLDLKHIDTVAPALELVLTWQATLKSTFDDDNDIRDNDEPRVCFWNADVLPGPGHFTTDVPGPAFLSLLESLLVSNSNNDHLVHALSLGWKVDVCWPWPLSAYTLKHIHDMQQLPVGQGVGVVWAVHARLLARSSTRVLEAMGQWLLDNVHNHQLLVWTGTGEPPLAPYTRKKLQRLFGSRFPHQVGYDVQVAPTIWHGLLYDIAMWWVGWKHVLWDNFLWPWIQRVCSIFVDRRLHATPKLQQKKE